MPGIEMTATGHANANSNESYEVNYDPSETASTVSDSTLHDVRDGSSVAGEPRVGRASNGNAVDQDIRLGCPDHTYSGCLAGALRFTTLVPLSIALLTMRNTSNFIRSSTFEDSINQRRDAELMKARHQFDKGVNSVVDDANRFLGKELASIERHRSIVSTPADALLNGTNALLASENDRLIEQEAAILSYQGGAMDKIDSLEATNDQLNTQVSNTRSIVAATPGNVTAGLDQASANVTVLGNGSISRYDAMATKAADFKTSLDEALVKLTQLKSDIAAQVEKTCANVRDHADDGPLREMILAGPVAMCDAIDATLGNVRRQLDERSDSSDESASEGAVDWDHEALVSETNRMNRHLSRVNNVLRQLDAGPLSDHAMAIIGEIMTTELNDAVFAMTGIGAVLDGMGNIGFGGESEWDPQADKTANRNAVTTDQAKITASLQSAKEELNAHISGVADKIDNGIVKTVDASVELVERLRTMTEATVEVTSQDGGLVQPRLSQQDESLSNISQLFTTLKNEMLNESGATAEDHDRIVQEALSQLSENLETLMTTFFEDLDEAWEGDLEAYMVRLENAGNIAEKTINSLLGLVVGLMIIALLNNCRKGRGQEIEIGSWSDTLSPKLPAHMIAGEHAIDSAVGRDVGINTRKPWTKLIVGCTLAGLVSPFQKGIWVPYATQLSLPLMKDFYKSRVGIVDAEGTDTHDVLVNFAQKLRDASVENESVLNNAADQFKKETLDFDAFAQRASAQVDALASTDAGLGEQAKLLRLRGDFRQYVDIASGKTIVDNLDQSNSSTDDQEESFGFDFSLDELDSILSAADLFDEHYQEKSEEHFESVHNRFSTQNQDAYYSKVLIAIHALAAMIIEGSNSCPPEKLDIKGFIRHANQFTRRFNWKHPLISPVTAAVAEAHRLGRAFKSFNALGYWDKPKDVQPKEAQKESSVSVPFGGDVPATPRVDEPKDVESVFRHYV